MQQVVGPVERVQREAPPSGQLQKLLSGRRGRRMREYLTGYLMILPSLMLIFTFGLFPVGFALYISLHKWKITQGPFVGLKNYASAIDTLAYVLFFGVAVGLAYLAIRIARDILYKAREHTERPWIYLFLGGLHAGSVILFLRYIVVLAPEILGIADKVKRLERTRELFLQLMGEALRAESVWPAFLQWITIFALAWLLTIILWRPRLPAQELLYHADVLGSDLCRGCNHHRLVYMDRDAKGHHGRMGIWLGSVHRYPSRQHRDRCPSPGFRMEIVDQRYFPYV